MIINLCTKCAHCQVEMSYLGEAIAGSPFTAKAYDSNMVKLTPCEGA